MKPVRPIRSHKDLEAALKRIDLLWGSPPESEDGCEMEALAVLVEAYENEHFGGAPPSRGSVRPRWLWSLRAICAAWAFTALGGGLLGGFYVIKWASIAPVLSVLLLVLTVFVVVAFGCGVVFLVSVIKEVKYGTRM